MTDVAYFASVHDRGTLFMREAGSPAMYVFAGLAGFACLVDMMRSGE